MNVCDVIVIVDHSYICEKHSVCDHYVCIDRNEADYWINTIKNNHTLPDKGSLVVWDAMLLKREEINLNEIEE